MNHTESDASISPARLRKDFCAAALALRGYNITNLGRSPELLAHETYGPVLQRFLQRGSQICGEVLGRDVDLVQRVREQRETSLATYAEAISMIVAVEMAQLEMLRRFFDIKARTARVAYGFSLGEISALVAGGSLTMENALRIPLELTADSVRLAADVTLGVLFSRRGELPRHTVHRLCQQINQEGRGVLGVSAYLSPNSLLLVGQQDTIERFMVAMQKVATERVFIRRDEHRWPPLHTPIVWQCQIPNRSQHLMHTLAGGLRRPEPAVFSLVTGSVAYDDCNLRDLVGKWVDHPQRLWDAIDYTLASGVETVIHIGPQPNIIPATFQRLAVNVATQTQARMGMRALTGFIRRPWLQALLPRRGNLLRAPHLRHVILEDWLLAQTPAGGAEHADEPEDDAW